MDIFFIYCLFAMTTSLTSLYELIRPVLNKANLADKVPHPSWIYYVTFFFLGTLVAPAIFLCCIIPSWSIEFQDHLEKALFDYQ